MLWPCRFVACHCHSRLSSFAMTPIYATMLLCKYLQSAFRKLKGLLAEISGQKDRNLRAASTCCALQVLAARCALIQNDFW